MESAGKESCCIFRVPRSFAEMNPTAYMPKVVSIGPYHYGEAHLRMIQEHKPRFLKIFLNKARKKGVTDYDLVTAVMELEKVSRISYSENPSQGPKEFVYMMVLDGCFVLMLLLIVSRIIQLDVSEDPIFTIPWILPAIQSDLLLLENQVPFIVLQTLMKVSKIGVFDDLNWMAFRFFNLSLGRPERHLEKYRNLEGKHLLDLIRMSLTPNKKSKGESEDVPPMKAKSGKVSPSDFTLIMSSTRLSLRGITFIRSDADSLLDIRWKRNKLHIPLLRLDGFSSSIFLNCVAFEQSYAKSTNEITSYVVFMGCLLNGEEDATFLSDDNRIIENYFGSKIEVSQFFKNICKDVVFDINTSYLRNVFEQVNEYSSRWYAPLMSTWARRRLFTSLMTNRNYTGQYRY